MSKSKRVFLTMMGDDDFWGNDGGPMETGDDVLKTGVLNDKKYFDEDDVELEEEVSMVKTEEEESDMEHKYFFQKKVVVDGEEYHSCEEEMKEDDKGKGDIRKSLTETTTDEKEATSIDSRDAYHFSVHTFLNNRPDWELQAISEGSVNVEEEKFLEIYDSVRKRLEHTIGLKVPQILRKTAHLNHPDTQQIRSKHTIAVSNFREPDRRFGRYSKYYYHHNVGPEVYSRKVFVGGLPACLTEFSVEILSFFSKFGRLQVDWPSKYYGFKSDSEPSICSEAPTPPPRGFTRTGPFPRRHASPPPPPPIQQPQSHLSLASPPFGQINPFLAKKPSMVSPFPPPAPPPPPSPPSSPVAQQQLSTTMLDCSKRQPQHLGYVFLLFEKERSVRDLVAECVEEEEGLFIGMDECLVLENVRVQIRPWLLADAEFLMDFNVPINTKLVAFIGGVPRPLKAVELAHFFEQTYGNVVCVGIDIDNKYKYPRGSGRVAFSNYDAYVQAITDRYIVLDHEDIPKRVEIKPYFFHNQSCEECSGRYHRQHAPFFCPSLECFQYYCEPCWHKMHVLPTRSHHVPVVKGV